MLSRNNRIRTNSFRTGSTHGRSFFSDILTVRVTKTGSPHPPQVAVIVSKKVAKSAPARNRIRRRVYGALDVVIKKMPEGFQFFFYPKNSILSVSSEDVRRACLDVLTKSGLV